MQHCSYQKGSNTKGKSTHETRGNALADQASKAASLLKSETLYLVETDKGAVAVEILSKFQA